MELVLSKNGALKKALPVHGVGNGPSSTPFRTTRAKEFMEAGIPFSRTHDTEGAYGSGEYINIHCIFKNFDADVNSPESYNFKNTDIYIAKILEAGTKVFYRLGETIENQPIATDLPRYIIPPKDYMKWAEICEHIIRHYNEGWADGFYYNIEYWEIWNEPDNSQMWTGTPEEFYELYRVAANHLKSCFPALKIGGMASSGFYAATRDTENSWFKSLIPFAEGFLKYISDEKTKAPLDFFSWHCYTHEVDEVARAARYARALLDKYGFNAAESILDEWNYALKWDGAEGKYRKSMPVAAMVAGVLITMASEGVDAGMYYDAEVRRIHYCGLFNEYTQACEKPYFALRTYNEIYKLGILIDTGFENGNGYYAIGASDGENTAVMLSNFEREDMEISMDISRFGNNAELIVTDAEHDFDSICELSASDGKISFTLNKNTIVLVKIS